jgi:hypothetical protein
LTATVPGSTSGRPVVSFSARIHAHRFGRTTNAVAPVNRCDTICPAASASFGHNSGIVGLASV